MSKIKKEREEEREKLSEADHLIPLQGSRDMLVQTQTLFSPPPQFILHIIPFISCLSKGDLKPNRS